jgi:hypothetical protein
MAQLLTHAEPGEVITADDWNLSWMRSMNCCNPASRADFT